MMSSDEHEYGNPDTRKRILDVAIQLAAELGPSMRLVDVSRAAGISHQGLYLHFRGRDALLVAMLPHMVETFDLHNRHQQVLDAPNSAQAIDLMVEFMADLNQRLDTIGWVLEEAQHLDEAFGRDYRRRVAGLRDAIHDDVILRAHEDGLIRPEWSIADATDLFLAMTAPGTWRELTRELGWAPEEYTQNVIRLIKTALLASST